MPSLTHLIHGLWGEGLLPGTILRNTVAAVGVAIALVPTVTM
jgi:hypothetical protein